MTNEERAEHLEFLGRVVASVRGGLMQTIAPISFLAADHEIDNFELAIVTREEFRLWGQADPPFTREDVEMVRVLGNNWDLTSPEAARNSVKCENCLTAPATHISHDGVDLCAKCHFAIPTDTLRPLTEKDMDTLSEMLGVKAVAERKAVASIDAILDAMEDAVNLHLDSPVTGDFMSLRRNWREHLNEALSRGDAARAELHRVRNVAVDLLAKRAEDMREYEKEIDRLRTVLLGFSQAWDCDDVATGAECRACLASGAIEINHSHSWKPRKRNWEGL